MEYMRCLNCNNNIPDDSAFCPFCGANISELKEKFEKERAERETQNNNGEFIKTYNQEATLKRAFLFLEDGEFDRADAYLETVLDNDPENAWAYVGKLMIDLNVKVFEDLKNAKDTFENNGNYIKAYRFGNEKLQKDLATLNSECIKIVEIRKEQATLERLYQDAIDEMEKATSEYCYIKAAEKFEKIKEYKDSAALVEECRQKAEFKKKMREEDIDSLTGVMTGLGILILMIIVIVLIGISFV